MQLMDSCLERMVLIFLVRSAMVQPPLASSSARMCTGTGSFPPFPYLSAYLTSLMNTKDIDIIELVSDT